MKGLTSAFARRARQIVVRMGRARARGELLQLSDRVLEDVGISRRLLEQGIDAWPWRETNERPVAITLASQPRPQDIKKAIAELQRYSDAELRDLGIERSQIETVVVHGRDGIDRPRKVAA